MAFGGIPGRRPDQAYRRPQPGMLPGPLTNIIRAREVITGQAGQPQVIVDSTLNYTIALTGFGTDVASITHVRAAVRYPTGSPAEVANGFTAAVIITYTDSSVAGAILECAPDVSLSGLDGAFTLSVGLSNTVTKSGGTIFGRYQLSGSTLTLRPDAMMQAGVLTVYADPGVDFTGGAGPIDLTSGSLNLMPAPESWHAMTLNGPTWANAAGQNTAAFRMDITGNIQMVGRVTGNPGTSATIGTLPANYRPVTNPLHYPCSVVSSGGLTAGQTPRLTLDSTGAVTIAGLAAGAATLDLDGAFRLSGGS